MIVEEVDSFTWRDWAGRLGAVLCLAIVGIGLFQVQESRLASEAATSYPVCESVGQDDCLIAAEARVVDQRGRSYSPRYHVVPTDPVPGSVEEEWVRLPNDGSLADFDRAVAEVAHGNPVTTLYWDNEPVRFETSAGPVIVSGNEPDGWTGTIWMSIFFLGIAYTAWFYPQNRRGNPPFAVQVGNFFALPMLLAALGTLFADTIAGQVKVFVGTTLVLWALLLGPRLPGILRRARN